MAGEQEEQVQRDDIGKNMEGRMGNGRKSNMVESNEDGRQDAEDGSIIGCRGGNWSGRMADDSSSSNSRVVEYESKGTVGKARGGTAGQRAGGKRRSEGGVGGQQGGDMEWVMAYALAWVA